MHPFAPPAILLAGPTASGKSALALALADDLAARGQPVEVVSVDSALVYRGMDIGTAKPSAAERERVPHHLIDIRDPLHAYSAAEFVRDATALVGQIRARGALALLVGGTMLYHHAWLHGIDELPAANAALRLALTERGRREGWPALHAELAQVDPATAARLAPNDSQRIQRALEIWQLSGQPMSRLIASKPIANNSISTGDKTQNNCVISLVPGDRAWLHARIAQRFDAMLDAGFLDEVDALRRRGDLHPDLPSMRCVGYRQAWHALERGESLASLREQGIAATRQLAKRQITWLRGMAARQGVHRAIACDRDAPFAPLREAVLRWLDTGRADPAGR